MFIIHCSHVFDFYKVWLGDLAHKYVCMLSIYACKHKWRQRSIMKVTLSLHAIDMVEGKDWSYYSNINIHNCPFLNKLVD